jgi:hypothetical protein
MLKKNFSSLLLVFGMTAFMWSCGDDDDSPAATGGSKATGGSAGKASTGGAVATGGTATTGGAKATGGTATTGGAKATGGTGTTGGAATTGGASTGGTTGGGTSGGTTGGTGPQGGGGAGGVEGGMGGESGGIGGGAGDNGAGAGGVGGDNGGAGGDGGAGGSAKTIAQVCQSICAAQAGLACAKTACQAECQVLGTESGTPDDYEAMIRCEASKISSAGYYCADEGAIDVPAPLENSGCKTEVCAWTCNPETLVGQTGEVAAYCGCG